MVFPACALLVRRGVSAARLTISGRALVCPQIKPLSHVRSFSVCRCTSTESSRISTALLSTGVSSRNVGTTDCDGNSKFAPGCIEPRLVATLAEVEDLPNHPEVLLIDVREPAELEATGRIPTSINIPLKTVQHELGLGAEAFEAKYGRKKPTLDDPLIFSCRSGVRAGQAALQADQLGYRNVKNYVGSWLEYGPKHGLPV
ncbi:rhodanese domain-containing protein CG4456-like isoform X1 [Anopheles albimanus]|uniref:rhodanese domain-containing protein CG4456-like isoform X1 n=1 Tax=Anopheles albimanus TaxID=7167 RepID=UPI00163EF289|nr:rhodanese domain-containing protein CG4456-like isoform X1 [Anopheles albimanus]